MSSLFLPSRSEELRKEARQLKKELLAIKQRKEESSKPAVDEEKEGMEARFISLPWCVMCISGIHYVAGFGGAKMTYCSATALQLGAF